MADKSNELNWFYGCKMEQRFGSPSESLIHSIFYFVLAVSTVTGFVFLCSRLFDFVRLILSLFVLPGIPVWFPSSFFA